jgi:uncharacterized protein
MLFLPLPKSAAWSHLGDHVGFEVVHLRTTEGGHVLTGTTAAVADGQPWIVDYEIRIDARWRTRTARVTGRFDTGSSTRFLAADGDGRWKIDNEPAPYLDGCMDVDLESSALTNALPVHRLGLGIGAGAQAPAAYVRAGDLTVARLEQLYTRTSDQDGGERYDYAAPAFDFTARLVYDGAGLVLEYPGIAVRAC